MNSGTDEQRVFCSLVAMPIHQAEHFNGHQNGPSATHARCTRHSVTRKGGKPNPRPCPSRHGTMPSWASATNTNLTATPHPAPSKHPPPRHKIPHDDTTPRTNTALTVTDDRARSRHHRALPPGRTIIHQILLDPRCKLSPRNCTPRAPSVLNSDQVPA